MITVYFLPVDIIGNAEVVAGEDIIHDAILQITEDPSERKLIMNTTLQEHEDLIALANAFRDPTPQEIDLYNQKVVITPPDPDIIRAEELLATSPGIITMPEIWELLRIFGRRLGYRF